MGLWPTGATTPTPASRVVTSSASPHGYGRPQATAEQGDGLASAVRCGAGGDGGLQQRVGPARDHTGRSAAEPCDCHADGILPEASARHTVAEVNSVEFVADTASAVSFPSPHGPGPQRRGTERGKRDEEGDEGSPLACHSQGPDELG